MSTLPTQSLAEKKEVERSTSLGTGLPTTAERYKRPELTPKPTKKENTNYDFVDDENNTNNNNQKKADSNRTISNDKQAKNISTTKKPSSRKQSSVYTGTDQFQSNYASTTSNSDKLLATDSAQTDITTLPQTGIEKNYWAIFGILILIVAIFLLYYFIRKKKHLK